MAAQSASLQYQAAFQHPQPGAFTSSTFDSSPSPVQGFYAGPPVTQATHQQAFPGQYHGVNGSTTMGPGGSMPTMMMHAGGQPPFQPHSSASYTQSVPAQAPPALAQQFHQQQQHQQQHSRPSASPQPQLSPGAGGVPASSKQQTPPAKYPMAAPPLPQTPAGQTQHHPAAGVGGGHAVPSPKSPQSPQSQGREQQRIALLFDINVELIHEIQRLQSEGYGGAVNAQQAQTQRNEGRPDKMASEEYIQCMRRLQANLAYLMPRASAADPSKAPPGPAHVTPPPHMAQLQSKYDRLKDLFPGWVGLDQRASMSASSPKPNGVAS